DLHEVVVSADDLLVPARDLLRLLRLALAEKARDFRVEAPREDDEPVGVLGEELPVHPGLVVEAFEVGLRDQLDEVLVADAMLHRGPAHSHSMVDGSFDEISKTTRLTPFTSLMMRFEMRPSRS